MTRGRCLVPFCNHTTKRQFNEWICGEHWLLVPKPIRRAHTNAKRRYNAKPCELRARACDRAWRACKDEAVVAASMA